jgi:tetratricopeptide (TPR) repeat protein
MKTTSTGVELLMALDRGAYREAIKRYETSHPSDDPVETIWRAEVSLYLNHLDDARGELDRLPGRLDRDLANRVQIIRAEIAFQDKSLDEAVELVSPAIQSTWETGDHERHLRAILLRARVELRRGNSAEALERLKEPRRLASLLDNDYYAGIIAHCRAFAFYQQANQTQAGHAFTEALHLLARAEGLKWEGMCHTLYGAYLADMGRYEDSLRECEIGERISMEVGHVEDALLARNNAGNTLSMLGRFDEVVERLESLLDWQRSTRSVFAEQAGLMLLSDALCELGRYAEAERAARELVRVSELSGHRLHALTGMMMAAWAAARSSNPDAVTTLESLVGTVDAEGSEYERAEIRLYLADALTSIKPDVAAALCREARRTPATEEAGRLRRLVERVERTLNAGPIRFGPHGELILDPNRGWPEYDFTVETVKRFLIFGAVRESDNNRSEAARKLGLSRSRLHDAWHQLNGEPVRPRREGAGAEVGDEDLSGQ